MADIIKQAHAYVARTFSERLFKGFPCPVHQHLPVGPCIIGRAGHGGQIIPAGLGFQIGTGKLPVRQIQAHLPHVFDHPGQIVVTDLVTQAAGTAVDEHRDLILLQSEGCGSDGIKDLFHHLDFQKVVARSERAELLLTPLQRPRADPVRIGPGHDAPVFRCFQVFRRPIALIDSPF